MSEYGHRIAQLGLVELGMVAFDSSRLAQAPGRGAGMGGRDPARWASSTFVIRPSACRSERIWRSIRSSFTRCINPQHQDAEPALRPKRRARLL